MKFPKIIAYIVGLNISLLATSWGQQVIVQKRLLVMDQACAWPQLTVLPNGEIAALIWPYPNHGHHEGSAECWISQDDGLTWQMRSVPVPHEPGVARLNVAGGLVSGGDYVAIISGWAEKPTKAEVGSYKRPAKRLNPEAAAVARSHDHGKTWQVSYNQTFTQPDGQNVIPYGRVALLASGEAGVACYLDDVIFYTSSDRGNDWQKRGIISAGKVHNETTWLQLNNGDLFAVARRWDGGGVDGLRSTDYGKSWKLEERLTLPRQHPADLIYLPDGRLLLSYSSRNDGSWGIWVRIGDATAHNWGPPILLADMGEAHDGESGLMGRDGGYPSTVIVSDGSLVTAYYSKGDTHHQRYHVGIVKWNIDKPSDKTAARDAG